MKLKIPYSELAPLSLLKVVEFLREKPKPNLGEVTLGDIAGGKDLNNLLLADFRPLELFGRGVYLFFDGENAKYIGQTQYDFLGRMQQQLNPHQLGAWGWNAFLRYISGEMSGKHDHSLLTDEDHEAGLKHAKKFTLAMIDVSNENVDSGWIKELERWIQRGFKWQNMNRTIMVHQKVAKVRDDAWSMSLGDHMKYWQAKNHKNK